MIRNEKESGIDWYSVFVLLIFGLLLLLLLSVIPLGAFIGLPSQG